MSARRASRCDRREQAAQRARRGREADTSLRAARALFDLELYDECVSRAYYATSHLACGLLLTDGLEATSHRGVDHLLNLHFVRAGRLDSAHAKALARLMQFRLQADYSRAFRFTREGAAEELALAERTCAALVDELTRGGWLVAPTQDAT